jgi:hypothetical protein
MTPTSKPELTAEQMNALPESTPLQVMEAIVKNGGPLWVVVWCERHAPRVVCIPCVDASKDTMPFWDRSCWFEHAALIPAVLPETTRAMTWGDAWDMGLWIKVNPGQVTNANNFVEFLTDPVESGDNFKVSTSHRGPWYPPVMPVGRTMTGAEWMEWSKAQEDVK